MENQVQQDQEQQVETTEDKLRAAMERQAQYINEQTVLLAASPTNMRELIALQGKAADVAKEIKTLSAQLEKERVSAEKAAAKNVQVPEEIITSVAAQLEAAGFTMQQFVNSDAVRALIGAKKSTRVRITEDQLQNLLVESYKLLQEGYTVADVVRIVGITPQQLRTNNLATIPMTFKRGDEVFQSGGPGRRPQWLETAARERRIADYRVS